MTLTTLSNDALDELRRRVSGTVVAAGDAGFDAARAVWNAMIDRRPLAVVRAAGTRDIAATIAFARERALDLAVRGAGHHVGGNGTVDGGLVLDLGSLTAVAVDPAERTVRAGAGATLAHLDAATEPHGLAVPIGVVSGTGIAGLTLGGGVGWLTRAHGLAADNLVAVDVVTADGRLITATERENPDLFWAVRGGGGNFGVVSSFTFRAHPLGPQVLAGNFIYGESRWRAAWAAFDAWTRDLPDAMTAITTTLTPPPILGAGDEPLLLLGFAWASPDRPAGEEVVARLRALAPPDAEEMGDVRWVDWQSAVDAIFPRGVRAYWRNTSFDRLDPDVIDVLVRRGAEQRWFGTAFDVHHLGGAFGRVAEEATPFPRRDSRFWLNVYGFWAERGDDDARIAFVRGLAADMEPFATGGQYLNFQGSEPARAPETGPERQADQGSADRGRSGHRHLDAAAVYGAEKFARLAAVKRRYDPDNVFHLNLNISPSLNSPRTGTPPTGTPPT